MTTPPFTARIWILAISVLLAASIGACGDDEYSDGDLDSLCGAGDLISIDGDDYCVYEQGIIEEGFRCPEELANRFDFDGFTACGPDAELPNDFEERARDLGGFEQPDPNPNNDPNNAPNNLPGNNDPTDPVDNERLIQSEDCLNVALNPLPPVEIPVLFQGAATFETEVFPPPAGITLTNEDDYQSFVAQLSPYGATTAADLEEALSDVAVDFDSNIVVAMPFFVGSSCNDLPIEEFEIGVLNEGGIYVRGRAHHTDGACESVCSAEAHALIVVSVPIVTTPDEVTFCREIRATCEF